MNNLVEVELSYKKLYDLFGEGEYETEYLCDEDIFVKTPSNGYQKVLGVIKKENKPIIHVDFEDGDSFECSEKHLFSVDGESKFAKDCEYVDTVSGKKRITEMYSLGEEDVYDINIPAPHWYLAKSDIIHHNTFFVLGMVKNFLDQNPDAGVLYFESESAITKQMIESRGIDSSRIVILPVTTVQEFRTQSIRVLDKYLENKERKPMMLVLDSLGMLSTTKEIEDTAEGKETRDMTRAQLIKATFRVLTLKLGKANVPLVITNHTYDSMGSMYPTKEMSGGTGLKYSASSIIFLSKKKDKSGTEVIGNIVHCKNYKSRLTIENKMVDVRLSYQTGLDKYYGLLELGEKYKVFKKVATRYEMPDGAKLYAKNILENPEKYFTKDVLDILDECAKKEFLYGSVYQATEEEGDDDGDIQQEKTAV